MANFHVAIIGAGLSGLALALALHEQSIACTLYEAREAPRDTGGGLMLTPNGLKVLKGIGIYETLLEKAYAFDNIYFQMGSTGAIVDSIEYGDTTRYGMRALRAYRYDVLDQLLKKVRHEEIPIHFRQRFSHILSETDTEVSWQFADGSSESASILVGADSIHSSVRKYIAPGVEPSFGGFVSLVAAIPTAQLKLPSEDLENLNSANNKYPLPSGIIVPLFGAFVTAPQTKKGDEVTITVMRPFPAEPERWGPIDGDKETLRSMFRENAEQFPEITGGGGQGRVLILGDAAHAIPPTSGQGVNQAFEDVYLLAGVLGALGGDLHSKKLQPALYGWQLFRQERIDAGLRLNKLMEIRRMPAAAQAKQGVEMDPESLHKSMKKEFDTLFSIDYTAAMTDCLRRGNVV